MQTLCNTRKIALSIEPYMGASVRGEMADFLHDARVAYIAYEADDGHTWVTALTPPVHSAVPLVHVLAARLIEVVAEVESRDPLLSALRRPESLVGLTVMQEWTRDRFRLMGRLSPSILIDDAATTAASPHSGGSRTVMVRFTMVTSLAMGLCPKYIVDRRITHRRPPQPTVVEESRSDSAPLPLPPAALDLVARTDTFWLGSTERSWGSQSSHRGGLPGFVRIFHRTQPSLTQLRWGDFKGNSMFHTLGTALVNPLVGLTILDYELGHVLQLAGRLHVEFAPQPGTDLDGASRHILLDVMQWRWSLHVLPFTFRTLSQSIHSPQLSEAQSTPTADRHVDDRSVQLTLTEVRPSGSAAKTFRFRPSDPSVHLQWLPAQYATLRLDVEGREYERSWTITSLSSALSQDATLDVTVKREEKGVTSAFLHDRAAVGTTVRLLGIEGAFSTPSMYWTESAEGVSAITGPPLRKLWLSAGIGITPFLAHMRTLSRFHAVHAKAGVPVPRSDIVWLHVDRSIEHVPALEEIAAFVRRGSEAASTLTVHFVLCLTRLDPSPAARPTAAAQLFGEDLHSDENGHMPRAQVVGGRPTAASLLHLCRCPPPSARAVVRCDDREECANAVTLDDRGVDACGSTGVVEQFRAWTEVWKSKGIVIRNFRTESFAY